MILTQCAACAAPLPRLAKQCSRCKTRYCSAACQKKHWEEGGHDTLCKKIKKAGGAEQYHANKKYGEAVVVAAEACAEDTKGQTCYICMEAVHRRTKEGLVRRCAYHTTEGFAHVSCLAEQTKILVVEAVENRLDWEALNARWQRWNACGLCEQEYHGFVKHALGWACWKTYVGLPESDLWHGAAMAQLGNGLYSVSQHEDALSVKTAELSLERRLGAPELTILSIQANLASSYEAVGRTDEGLCLRRDVYSKTVRLVGEESSETLLAAMNYAMSLRDLQHYGEARSLMRKEIPVAQRVLGENHDLTLRMRRVHAVALYKDTGATLDDLRDAVKTLNETERTARRVLGGSHPDVVDIVHSLRDARAKLAARESGGA